MTVTATSAVSLISASYMVTITTKNKCRDADYNGASIPPQETRFDYRLDNEVTFDFASAVDPDCDHSFTYSLEVTNMEPEPETYSIEISEPGII